MSRNPPPSGARYKISNPQPVSQNNFSERGPHPSYTTQPQQSPYPSSATSSSSPYPGNAPPQNGENSRLSAPLGPSGSPARPARSRMRETPSVPSPSAPSVPSAPSAQSRRDRLAPIQTQAGRGPSDLSVQRAYDVTSPISPISPVDTTEPQGNGLFSDPFAADRSQRTELRAQASAAAQQATQPFQSGAPGDKLRNVVGAFMAAGRQREEVPARRPGKSEARQRQKAAAPREEVWDVSEGGKFGEIDSVMRKISQDWPFVLESDFSPSTLALSLLSRSPSSSLPQHPPLSSFMRLHDSLSVALQSAVQSHFQTFAASLPAHANFLATLARAQQQVKKSKEDLKAAREGFAGKGKSELAGVRARERMVRDMLKILDTIDNLKQVPDQLESLIGDKHFLRAALLLVRSRKTINKPELAEMGALADLKAYLVSQETTLADILVEELHSHIYLKTFYSDSRWRPYFPGQQSLPLDLQPEDVETPHPSAAPSATATPIAPSTPTVPSGDTLPASGPGPSTRFERFLSALAVKPSHDPMLDYLETDVAADPATITHRHVGSNALGQAASSNSLSSFLMIGAPDNPETDSFAYIESLLEALAVLGRLGAALETFAQRVPGEAHALVEATLDEVEERSEARIDELDAAARPQSLLVTDGVQLTATERRKSLFAPSETIRIAMSLHVIGPPRHAAILRDLFWTLYSKFAAVLEGHRIVYEVSRWISSRRDFKDNSGSGTGLAIPVLEVWKPVQQELRGLLAGYLSDETQGSALNRHPLMSINEVLRDGKVARDRQKQMFQFSDTDSRAVSNEIKAVDDSLQSALKVSVPGLVNLQLDGTQQSVLQGTMANSSDERYSAVGRHRVLIPANAFNVTTLFKPTLAFIERAISIIPPGFEEETSAFGSVLEEFVVRVFLPQLDERVTASFQQAVSGYDAYQVDRRMANDVAKPPLKSSVRVMALIHSLCVMLQTTPFHRENYSRLIVGVIVQYYQQCSARFKELASLGSIQSTLTEPPLALPAVWAQRDDMISCLTEVRAVMPSDKQELASVGVREIKLEMDLLGDKPLVDSQLIRSSRKLESLGNLAESLRWFVDSLLDLQTVAEEPLSPGTEVPSSQHMMPPSVSPEADAAPKLPLTRAMFQRFEAIVQTYEQLADMVLNTMRLEIRGRVICNLGASLRKGDFRLESDALEPDSDIVDLNAQLTESEDVVSRTLSVDDRTFVLRGLGQLADHTFIQAARNIKVVNAAGVKKIKRDVLALQQSLRGMFNGDEGVLSRSAAYWDMYDRGPKDMLEGLREGKPIFSFEDYNTMLNLQCKTDQSEAPSSELNGYLIDLHALSMSIDGWEIGES